MLKIKGLNRTFPANKKLDQAAVAAVDDLSVELEPGELFTMLGPSGCGKTTTLRCVAGLERPDAGEITLGDRVLFSSERKIDVDANQRGLGMVFQSYAIWPHMDVFRNIAFPLEIMPRKSRPSKKEIRVRVERVLDVVQLGHLAGRRATDLSGGQQQRLALARALVMEPPLLLLDEPLSNLDAKLREGMRFELKRLQRDLGVTAVYVTHDQVEALAMSNRIAVMRHGRIEQLGKPREIYGSPTTRFVADFIGSANFIEGQVVGPAPQGTGFVIRTAFGEVTAGSAQEHTVGDGVLITVRPESMSLDTAAGGDWTGEVAARAFLGDGVDHMVKLGEVTLRVKTSPRISIPDGTPVRVLFEDDACAIVPDGGGGSLASLEPREPVGSPA
ncbi:ABC transporter ATP-binding protein [Nocardioides humi]|uniref:ABC transporter ATP-binding protein n=1 Tax=Nocardioides humi TaxID=449461 RepID=A0ABN2A7J8_9ACTN|nr:ABC transporter ATP-binding protein [Nocardioides humi]